MNDTTAAQGKARAIYQTKDGETLDYICWRYYGKTTGIVEKVLLVNRHLSEYGAVLPAGILINLPPLDEPESNKKIKIWQ